MRHQDRGAFVDDIERFHHMLLFAVRISRDGGGVFEIKLPVLHRWGTFNRIGESGEARGNASIFLQESVNSAGRLRPPHPHLFQGLIATQIVEDRLGTWGAT